MGLVVAFLLLLLALMFIGWRARQRRQAGLAQPESVPEDIGDIHGVFESFYVATTVAGDQLNRIAVRGLGYRSRARLTVADAGVVLAIRGEHEVFIPKAAIREVSRATWTIDRVVEEGGLIRVAWNLGPAEASTAEASTAEAPAIDTPTAGALTAGTPTTEAPTPVDSYFRLDAATELLAALNLIFTAPTGRKA
jgi:hypothetical protein